VLFRSRRKVNDMTIAKARAIRGLRAVPSVRSMGKASGHVALRPRSLSYIFCESCTQFLRLRALKSINETI